MPRSKGALNKKTTATKEDLAVAQEIAAPDVAVAAAETSITVLQDEDKDPWSGLTERQILIQRLKMRGIPQKTIGQICGGISQTMVCKELKAIREIHKQRGVALDREAYVGESISIHEELLTKAWDIFYRIPDDNPIAYQTKLQAINTIASLRDKHTKLLTDLGIIDKVPQKHEHDLRLSRGPSVVDNWSTEKKQKIAEAVLLADFKPLEDPVPPEDDISDAEFTEVDNDEE